MAGALTPVPGGVGPLTIAMLLKNTLARGAREAAAELQVAARSRSGTSTCMLRVALTGGIATGKSYVLDALRRARRRRASTPTSSRTASIAPGTEATRGDRRAVRRRRARAPTAPSIARSSARSSSPIARRAPRSRSDRPPGRLSRDRRGLRAFELLGGTPLAVVDIPLLFETGARDGLRRVIVTACPPETQSRGCVARGLSRGRQRAQRLAAQWPTDEKAARADFVDRHRRDVRGHRRQVDEIFERSSVHDAPDAAAGVLDFVSDLDFRRVLRRRDPLLDERVPVVAVRALPEQLGAAVAAAHADVRVEVEDRVLGQLAVAVDERRRDGAAGRARARSPGGC